MDSLVFLSGTEVGTPECRIFIMSLWGLETYICDLQLE